MILNGELDEVEENDFYMKGGIDSVIGTKNPNHLIPISLEIVTPSETIYSEEVIMWLFLRKRENRCLAQPYSRDRQTDN